MSTKIHAIHLQRDAYVYVRQSTGHQVRAHPESQRRQYALADQARGLGFAHVIVIDEDVGRSGTGRHERPGFGQLLAAVCEGRVGAVFALEASRLARNNRDWHHLIDLCALTETLLIDDDGIYDPRQLNDRLVLGMKGSMAEYELGLMRQRARQAFEAKIQRGHVMWEVPVGFVRTRDDRIEKIADRQVQHAVAGVFQKFRELGSARQTMLWYREAQLPLPEVRPGTLGQDILLALAQRASHPSDAAQSVLCRGAGLWPYGSEDRDRRWAGAAKPSPETAGGAVAYCPAGQSRRVHELGGLSAHPTAVGGQSQQVAGRCRGRRQTGAGVAQWLVTLWTLRTEALCGL